MKQFILPIPDTYPVRYYNPSPLNLKESNYLHNQSLEAAMQDELDLWDDPDSDAPEPEYSEICKVEPAERLNEAMVFTFEEFLRDTGNTPRDGAILVTMKDASNESVNVWLPKKCCSNLSLDNATVCVWDKIAKKKIDEVNGFFIEPVYYEDWIADNEANN